ncbi:unnamed protein product [Hymenolepis diminuta]|uniref:Uncharacterized protein n=1 Tax=Hymenolepis diminuta TaxID=6216 RepID=A0A564ZDW5_HYMDI|nr:unnamed protein product [Hymenolepis diminuta]VUZ57028.1 unnamed protein product [Hymenolepis diminuta]
MMPFASTFMWNIRDVLNILQFITTGYEHTIIRTSFTVALAADPTSLTFVSSIFKYFTNRFSSFKWRPHFWLLQFTAHLAYKNFVLPSTRALF